MDMRWLSKLSALVVVGGILLCITVGMVGGTLGSIAKYPLTTALIFLILAVLAAVVWSHIRKSMEATPPWPNLSWESLLEIRPLLLLALSLGAVPLFGCFLLGFEALVGKTRYASLPEYKLISLGVIVILFWIVPRWSRARRLKREREAS